MHTNSPFVKKNCTELTPQEKYLLNNTSLGRAKRKHSSHASKPSHPGRIPPQPTKAKEEPQPDATDKHYYVREINGTEVSEQRKHINSFKEIIYVSGKLLCLKDSKIRLPTKIVLAGMMTVVWNTNSGQPNHNRILTTYSEIAKYFHITKRQVLRVLKTLKQQGFIEVEDFECTDVCQSSNPEIGKPALTKRKINSRQFGSWDNREKIKEITVLKEYKYIGAEEHPVPYVRINLEHFIQLSNNIGGEAALLYFYLYGRTKKQSKTYKDEQGRAYRYIKYEWLESVQYIGMTYKRCGECLQILTAHSLVSFERGKGFRLHKLVKHSLLTPPVGERR